jgi:hypothetical protein
MSLILSGTNGLSDVDGSAATPAIRGTDTNTGIFFPAADTIAFAEGGAESMRLDSSGNVGVGTTSPGTKLDVAGNLRFSAANPVIELNNGGAQIYSTVANTLQFASGGGIGSPTERARIDTSGRLLLNTNTAFAAGHNVQIGSTGDLDIGTSYRVFSNGNWAIAFNNASTSVVGQIVINAGSVSYNSSSDYRLKHDIQPMTGALAKVQQLKPVTYKWNIDDSESQGFIAHELQEVVPDCVTGEKDAVDAEGNPQYQGIDTSFLVATLTAAIQEQQALIQTLTARVAALEGAQQ